MALSPFISVTDSPAKYDDANGASASLVDRFGVLQPQEVILGLSGEYVRPSERAWSGGLVQVLGDLGFSKAASRVALNRVIARGLLKPEKEGRFVFYRITSRMRMVLEEGRRQTFSAVADPEWAGRWTVVMYAEDRNERVQRSRLGRWLSFRGFGALQEGVWIAAGDSEADVILLARRLKMERQVITFVGELGPTLNLRQTAMKAWKLNELKAMYEIFIKEFGQFSGSSAEDLDARKAFVTRTRLIEMFRQTTIHDCLIPDRLIKMGWRRREAIKLFQELQTALKPSATAYFRSIVITGENIE